MRTAQNADQPESTKRITNNKPRTPPSPGERLYDPAAYHDRLLLGLSGIMSEAELHQIKIRLHQGERQKVARGELRLPLPAGLIHNHDGGVTFNPDEEVQERLRLVFAKFRELRTAKAVVRYLRRGNLSVPVRPLHGPAPHDVVWRAANSARVVQILKNPAYAGAYVYGRRRPDPLRRQPGSERVGTVAVAPKSGRSVLRTRTRLMSIGTSSWRTVGSWRTTSLATMRTARSTAQGQWIAAGDRQLWSVRPPHDPALLGSGRRLSGLRLRC